MDDELLLAPVPDPPIDRTAERYARTVGVLRRQTHWRYVRRALGIVAVFAVGVGTGWWAKPQPVPTVVPVVEPVPPVVSPEPILSASAIELQAEQADERAALRLFRQAGDAYAELGEWPAALRCYRNALDLATPSDLQPSSDDTWLVSVLKRQRLEENVHAQCVP